MPVQESTALKGRIIVYVPGHPGASNTGYILRARWVMEKHLGRPLLSSETVHHINGDKTDDRVENLELMTCGEHTKAHWRANPTRVYDQLTTYGEGHYLAKLTVNAVREIRERYATGSTSQRKLAKEYGVERTTIRHVLNGKTWRHVK